MTSTTPPPPQIPPELQHINAFIRHADDLENNEKHNDSPESRIVAHYCRMHAAHEGMSYATSDEGKRYLSDLLDRVESEMEEVSIITKEESHVLCRNYANQIYKEADMEDKRGHHAGGVSKKTAELFEAAATFYEILPQFYSGDDDGGDGIGKDRKEEQREEERKMNYCRKRAVEILGEIEERARSESSVFKKGFAPADASVSSLSLSDTGGLRDNEDINSRGGSPGPLTCPDELESIRPFIHHAQELDSDASDNPESRVVSHYCRMHAVHVGMTHVTSDEGKEYIAHLLSHLEEEENDMSIISREESHLICKNHADQIYNNADAQDKLFAAGKETAELFEAAATFYEILEQFYPDHNEEDQKSDDQKEEELKMEYSRKRAVEILESMEERAKVGGGETDVVDFFAQGLANNDNETPFDLHDAAAENGDKDSSTKDEKGSNDEFGLSALLPPESSFSDKDYSSDSSIPLPTKDAIEKEEENDAKNDKPQASDKGATTVQSDGEIVHVIDQLDNEVDNAMEDFNQSTLIAFDEEATGAMIHFTDEEANFWSKMGFSVQEAAVADSMDNNFSSESPRVKPKLLRPSILRTVTRPTSQSNMMEKEVPTDPKARDENGLPLDGEYFKATLPDGHFGAIFFRASEMRNKLYATAPRSFIKSLKNRPVVAYTASDSVIDSAGICLGDVILKVQNDEVEDPKRAMYFVHELRNKQSSFAGIELFVWRPPPSIDVMPSENQCMVEYHSRSIDAPSSSSGWKAKYVVVGGIVAKPHIINMYYNKKDYDKAVADTLMKKRKLSVKVKSWSLQGARLITPKLNFVHYEDKKEPWYYFIVSTSKGKSIKIAHPIIDGINPVLEGVKRALKSANYANHVE